MKHWEFLDNKTDINHLTEFPVQNFSPLHKLTTEFLLYVFLLNRIVFMHANNDKHIHFRRVLCVSVHTFFNTLIMSTLLFFCFCVIFLFLWGVFKPFIFFILLSFVAFHCVFVSLHGYNIAIINVKIFLSNKQTSMCLATHYTVTK